MFYAVGAALGNREDHAMVTRKTCELLKEIVSKSRVIDG